MMANKSGGDGGGSGGGGGGGDGGGPPGGMRPFLCSLKRRGPQRKPRTYSTLRDVRLRWGQEQEATSLLAVLNGMWAYSDGSRRVVAMREAGLTLRELQRRETEGEGVRGGGGGGGGGDSTEFEVSMGASPDAFLDYDDGSIEVVEVKNHGELRLGIVCVITS